MAYTQEYRLRELRRVLQKIRSEGFAPQAYHPLEAAAVTMLANDILGDRPSTGTSTRMIGAISSLQDKSNANGLAHIPLACRKGCHYCCTIYVSATAPQVFAIADYVRANSTNPALTRERLVELEAATRGLDASARWGKQIPCPFLNEQICSIYSVRPSACRGFMSKSAEDCRLASADKNGPDITQPQFAIAYRSVVDQSIWALLYERKLPFYSYELGEAVMRVLDDPGAEQRWFSGEDVFADIPVDESGVSKTLPSELKQGWSALLAMSRGEAVSRQLPYAQILPRWCFE